MWRDFTTYGRAPRRFDGYFAIASAGEFARRRCASGPIPYFIDLTSDSLRTLRARLPLVWAGAVRITCSLGSIPTPDPTHGRSVAGRLRRALTLGPRAALGALRDTLLARAAATLTAPGLVVVAGRRSPGAANSRHPTLRAHNFDYDIYLKLARVTDRASPGYAVFVDQDYCFHPEFTCKESSTTITPEKYFPTVCNGLREISAALAMPVRIAAHPRASYRERPGTYFEGFQVEYGRTAELIRDSSAVSSIRKAATLCDHRRADSLLRGEVDHQGGSGARQVTGQPGWRPARC
jgi:hypothetical protein